MNAWAQIYIAGFIFATLVAALESAKERLHIVKNPPPSMVVVPGMNAAAIIWKGAIWWAYLPGEFLYRYQYWRYQQSRLGKGVAVTGRMRRDRS